MFVLRTTSPACSYVVHHRHVRAPKLVVMFIRRTSSSCSDFEARRHVRTSYIVVMFVLRTSPSRVREQHALTDRRSVVRESCHACSCVHRSHLSIFSSLLGLVRQTSACHAHGSHLMMSWPPRCHDCLCGRRVCQGGARNEGGQGRAIAWARASQSATGAVGITRAHCRAQRRRPRAWFSCCVLLPLPLPSTLRLRLLLLLLLRVHSRHFDDVIVTILS